MAEVLPLPMTPSSTITMLHSRPSSSDAFQGSSQQFSQSPRLVNSSHSTQGSMYNGQNTPYRGTSAAPVQPYAFNSTPNLRKDTRTSSAPPAAHAALHKHAHTQSASASSTTSSDVSSQPSAKDDSVMGSQNGSLINLSSAIPDLSLTSFDSQAKPSPDRYRRPAQRRNESANTTPKASQQSIATLPLVDSTTVAQRPTSPTLDRQESVDDMALTKSANSAAKRYRRRSLNVATLETSNTQASMGAQGGQRPSSGHGSSTASTIRPVSFHTRSGSDDSQKSHRQKDSHENVKPATGLRPEQKGGVQIPPRTSSEANIRIKAPSPLSNMSVDADTTTSAAGPPSKPRTYAAVAQAAVPSASAAAQHLAAVSDKDLNKGMKSRLRRAFSFGSAQELRRGAAENSNVAAQQAQNAREQQQAQIDDELDAEQQEIARRQEEAGIGAGIYSGQGGFTGSTDNLSISSTASSASMMLRKMGRGAKKSARSIKGLFRPKSVIGVPAADGPVHTQAGAIVQPSVAQVSMVTVEAERQKVNVNEHPTDKHGITGFPKLERNSIDAANGMAAHGQGQRASGDDSTSSRRSVVGSDKDRADILAAVKKGILKRSGTGSPSGSPVIRPRDAASESPAPSMPSTPKDVQGRSESLKNVNGDYFGPRLAASLAKSMPNTPNGSRSISFSPRIQFHDAWSSTEYDRRGEIATCNRLTPMLAQQIKEELNTFKMEMEVHEMSKPHTHFF
ncbi:related to BNI4 Bud neck involved [Ramularia collo-cygni]|uniref:Related to BNI4 Bud neck involved n=1 Tax=Ramularia collo-cygni TaxID=112498 RepID=A0A2D3UX58_9PEZI|nr:related to BNI4 Bud neck involved [Ramularia collo-cygni]CZT18905.1 related to BNI4 Bud neck involved [Ramularia collo-cygni]